MPKCPSQQASSYRCAALAASARVRGVCACVCVCVCVCACVCARVHVCLYIVVELACRSLELGLPDVTRSLWPSG